MTRKKPELYTKLGKPRKPRKVSVPAKREKSLEVDVTDLIAKLNQAYTEISLLKNSHEELVTKIYEDACDQAKRTVGLWFGYGLIRPAKK